MGFGRNAHIAITNNETIVDFFSVLKSNKEEVEK